MKRAIETFCNNKQGTAAINREPKRLATEEVLDQLGLIDDARTRLDVYYSSILWGMFRPLCEPLDVVSNDDCSGIATAVNSLVILVERFVTRERLVSLLVSYHWRRCLIEIYSTPISFIPETARIKCLWLSECNNISRLQQCIWVRESTHMLRYSPEAIRKFVVDNKAMTETLTRRFLCFGIEMGSFLSSHAEALKHVDKLFFQHKEDLCKVPIDPTSMETAIKYVKRKCEDSKEQTSAKKSKV